MLCVDADYYQFALRHSCRIVLTRSKPGVRLQIPSEMADESAKAENSLTVSHSITSAVYL